MELPPKEQILQVDTHDHFVTRIYFNCFKQLDHRNKSETIETGGELTEPLVIVRTEP